MSAHRPFVLVICDGWGESESEFGNAITAAHTPVFNELRERWPHTLVEASGRSVGLPLGQMGNSEVGHLTMGAGRIINQPLTRLNDAVADGTLLANDVLATAVMNARDNGGALHLLGMVSPGGVHSHQEHGLALAKLAARYGIEETWFHVFTDGRDEPPRSAIGFVGEFQEQLAIIGTGRIATIGGRYYSMDRDNRWERIERAYEVLTGGGPETDLDAVGWIEHEYAQDRSDEFIEPVRLAGGAAIRPGDTVIFWNFRPDRARQLTHAFVDAEFTHFARGNRIALREFVTFTEYDRALDVNVAFPRLDVKETLAEVVATAGLRQFHVAETEKYAHVTYFINGGREEPFEGEDRLLVPSPYVATYDTTPAMSAEAVTDAVIEHLTAGDDALIVVNFANPDMVGHTGIFDATVSAVEVVDGCLGRIHDAVIAVGGAMLMTADHGNAEKKIDARDQSPLTAHTTNPVPVVLCGTDVASLRGVGGLQDIAPTVLSAMGLPIPDVMTGTTLAQATAGRQ